MSFEYIEVLYNRERQRSSLVYKSPIHFLNDWLITQQKERLVARAPPLERRKTGRTSVMILSENQSTYTPLGKVRRLSNAGAIPLEIIEVQSGSYLGEDDIERFEDTYGRCN